MKFPDVFNGLLAKKEEMKEFLFSLYIDTDAAACAVWSMQPKGTPDIASFAHGVIKHDSWEARLHVIDRLLSAAEEKVRAGKAISKTVFGMPGVYLTPDGNIRDEIRTHLKQLSQRMELSAVGFVPLSQAIAFALKKDEGVPASVILVGLSGTRAEITIFRVGVATHTEITDISADPVLAVEHVFKSHQDKDVLPSRMLLYGGNVQALEQLRASLLKHPWPSRVNFLHFPKIEILPLETLLRAVSRAGAAELSHTIEEDDAAFSESETVVAQPTHSPSNDASEEKEIAQEDESQDESDDDSSDDDDELRDEFDEEDEDSDDEEAEDEDDEQDDEEEEQDSEEEVDEEDDEEAYPSDVTLPNTSAQEDDDIANVKMVSPESLGFHSAASDASRTSHASAPARKEETRHETRTSHKKALPDIRGVVASVFGRLHVPHLPIRFAGKKNIILFALIGIVGVAALVFAYVWMPRATVTLLVSTQRIDESLDVTVDPDASGVSVADAIVPASSKEQVVTGEKTVPATGKKNVGDPAVGTVTLYNKVTTGKTLEKGTVITANGLSFTLDSDVTVASASETIGSITFGKANVDVTAKAIGPNGNLSAGTEFTVAGSSSGSLSARNESAFSGGTSKQVTVVSRADQDAIVKSLTDSLVEQAKHQLMESGVSGEQLIEETIDSEVTEKVFDAEVNEEAKEVHGKISITVSGISVSNADLSALLTPVAEKKIPTGYAFSNDQAQPQIKSAKTNKDKTVDIEASITAVAVPVLDEEKLKEALAGKSVSDALAFLKETNGIAGAEFSFGLTPFKSHLPRIKDHIRITTTVQ